MVPGCVNSALNKGKKCQVPELDFITILYHGTKTKLLPVLHIIGYGKNKKTISIYPLVLYPNSLNWKCCALSTMKKIRHTEIVLLYKTT